MRQDRWPFSGGGVLLTVGNQTRLTVGTKKGGDVFFIHDAFMPQFQDEGLWFFNAAVMVVAIVTDHHL
jgi:hypothetical protein